MLRFVHDQCSPEGRITRREWLRLNSLAGLGLAASPFAGPSAGHAASPRALSSDLPGFGKARSVLLLYTSGGQSQLDTWDPKPQAPEEIRGEFRTIATSVPGLRLCEHLPRVARLAHLYTVVRSVCHDDLDHGTACYLALTGHFHTQKSANPLPKATDSPTYAAVLQRVRPSDRLPHTAVHVNGPLLVPEQLAPGQAGGFLGRGCDPLLIGDVHEKPVAIGGLDPLPDLPTVRLEARRSLLQTVESYRHHLGQDRALLEMNTLYR